MHYRIVEANATANGVLNNDFFIRLTGGKNVQDQWFCSDEMKQ